jgi:hypothetical protein
MNTVSPLGTGPARAQRRSMLTLDPTGIIVVPPERNRLPARITADTDTNLAGWISENRQKVDELLCQYGALFFRGFGIAGAKGLEQLVLATSQEPMNYVYGSTPRTRELRQIYSSTEYPANQPIPLHNELSYATTSPHYPWHSQPHCRPQQKSMRRTVVPCSAPHCSPPKIFCAPTNPNNHPATQPKSQLINH